MKTSVKTPAQSPVVVGDVETAVDVLAAADTTLLETLEHSVVENRPELEDARLALAAVREFLSGPPLQSEGRGQREAGESGQRVLHGATLGGAE